MGAVRDVMIPSLGETGDGLKARLNYYRAVYSHQQTPLLSKALLWVALAYLVTPFDIIPDFIVVVGHLDDLVIVPGLIWLALWMIPGDVLRECEAGAGKGAKD